eukprot:9113020-Pyramimonas_sp.AAC.1
MCIRDSPGRAVCSAGGVGGSPRGGARAAAGAAGGEAPQGGAGGDGGVGVQGRGLRGGLPAQALPQRPRQAPPEEGAEVQGCAFFLFLLTLFAPPRMYTSASCGTWISPRKQYVAHGARSWESWVFTTS